jgi:glucose-1-phosphate thymidylyltransferase
MRIIIPMAGMGKRMRPHTLTIPKPLLQIAGKPIVQRLVETLAKSTTEPIEEIAFVIGNFGSEVESRLISIANNAGAKGTICYQHEALGTAHAIYCAESSLEGKIIVAFADTLFHTDVMIDHTSEGIIWVKKVEDPSQFGVVLTDNSNNITSFMEKPQNLVSDMAIIGIYYFQDGAELRNEIRMLIDNKVIKSGEYQLTDVLQSMLSKGKKFIPQEVDEWLDCGNKDATVYTNRRILELSKNEQLINETAVITNSIIIPPCYLGEQAEILNSIVGPHVSIGKHTKIENAIVTDSIIQNYSTIINANIDNSMVGNYVEYKETYKELNIGDYTIIS